MGRDIHEALMIVAHARDYQITTYHYDDSNTRIVEVFCPSVDGHEWLVAHFVDNGGRFKDVKVLGIEGLEDEKNVRFHLEYEEPTEEP